VLVSQACYIEDMSASTTSTTSTTVAKGDVVTFASYSGVRHMGTVFALNFCGEAQVQTGPGSFTMVNIKHLTVLAADTVDLANATSEVREALFTFLAGRPFGRGNYSDLFIGTEVEFATTWGDTVEGVIEAFTGPFADIVVNDDPANIYRISCSEVSAI
jgi:hypothetical protein